VGKVENTLGGGQAGSQMEPGGTGTGTTGAGYGTTGTAGTGGTGQTGTGVGGFIQKAKDKLTGNSHQ
jgi:hypothetical protein